MDMLSLSEVTESIKEIRSEYLLEGDNGQGYVSGSSERVRERLSSYFLELSYAVAQDAIADAKEDRVLSEARRINQHILEGYQLGLCDIEIMMHDSVLGFIPDAYFRGILPYLHEVFEFMQQHPLSDNDNWIKVDTMLLRLVDDFERFGVIDDLEKSSLYYSNFLENYTCDNNFYQLIKLWN